MICGLAIGLSGCSLQPANRNYSKALEAYESGNYEEAESYFLEAIKINPDKAEYYLDYGFTLIQLGNYEEAIQQFDRIIMDSEITMVKENNKRAYRGKGIALLQMNDYSEALNAFEMALEMKELADLNNDILYYKGITLEYEGNLEEAAEIYSQLLENNDKDTTIYSARANIYRKLGKYEESIADYDKALEYEADDFELYFGKFSALESLGRDEEAMEVLNQASTITINTEEDKFKLAKVHFYQGNYSAASVEFLNSVSDGFSEANYYLAEMSLSEEKYEEAMSYLLAYENAGNAVSATFYNQLMVCYLNLGDYEKAKECLSKAKMYSTASVDKELRRNEIVLLEKTGDFEEAFLKMEQYIKDYTPDEETKKDYEFLKTRVQTQKEETDKNESSESEETTVEKP